MNIKRAEACFYSFLFVLGILFLGYYIPRTSFNLILVVYSGCFILYWRLYRISSSGTDWKRLLYLAVMLRLVLLFSIPSWSEDYVRFLWDGQLVAEGNNPYALSPAAAREQGLMRDEASAGRLFPLLNSPDYHSVYPPSNQTVFALAAYLSKGNLLQGVIIIRLVLFVFEMFAFYLIFLLLLQSGQPPQKLLLYGLNPLVIMEITGNLHFEGMMLTMILASIYWLAKSRYAYSGVFLAAAVGVKLNPVILFPAFFRRIPKKAVLLFSFAALFILLITLAPLFWSASPGFWQSISLYGNVFEFNASVYYLLRQMGFWVKGYNTIEILGPVLKGLTLILILAMSFGHKEKSIQSFLERLLLIYWTYFLLNTVVHPWYVVPAIGISVLTEKKAFILWSFLIILSYNAYRSDPYSESTWLLFLQYFWVGIALWKDGYLHNNGSPSIKY